MRSPKTSNAGCPSGMTQLPTGQIVSKQDAHEAGFEVPGYSAQAPRPGHAQPGAHQGPREPWWHPLRMTWSLDHENRGP